jgi:hypothetical protein
VAVASYVSWITSSPNILPRRIDWLTVSRGVRLTSVPPPHKGFLFLGQSLLSISTPEIHLGYMFHPATTANEIGINLVRV